MFSRKIPERGSRGFSLIELLIVVLILGLLASLVAPNMFKKLGKAKSKTAKVQIEMLGTSLDSYRLDTGKYPSSDQGLEALREDPGVDNWDGPYLQKDIPDDPWGNPYLYKHPGDKAEYDLYSLGADGQEGGEGEDADVGNWQ